MRRLDAEIPRHSSSFIALCGGRRRVTLLNRMHLSNLHTQVRLFTS